ncbi:MAG: signal recognition particle-docking protein FtsY [Propionibacteriaceae bacterium]|jgi:fused signal recognition particle receptor|nr:signal recognition particle-docking protein FtsY [Propionibacteriaceae bacterium]
MIFWFILAGLVAAFIAAFLVVTFSKRSGAPPEAGETAPASPPSPPEPEPDAADRTDQLDRPDQLDQEAPPATGPATWDQPEPTLTRLSRLRRRLASSDNALARSLASLLSSDRVSAETWDDFETTLITSDLGVGPTAELVERLRSRLALDAVSDPGQAKAILRQELIDLVDPSLDRGLALDRPDGGGPAVVLVVGVNGTGKTTTVGKLARVLVAEGRSVVLGAADTFRAAAADQLQTWGERIGVATVRGPQQADPASVAFDAAQRARTDDVDVLIVDTAGRLHNKVGLMDELGKVKRVLEKVAPVTETLLVLDATTGQNGLVQARVFAQAVSVSGIVLTKLDGSAKGGIVVAVQRELGVPVKFIGLGEGADDLAPFDPAQFVDGLLGD